MRALRLLIICTLIFPLCLAAETLEAYHFASPQKEARFNHLLSELRCLVCQNQNLLDSNAPLARDLKDKVYGFYQQGQSDGEIKDYLVSRYGDFILFNPPLKAETYFLWGVPFLLLLIGFVVAYRFLDKGRVNVK